MLERAGLDVKVKVEKSEPEPKPKPKGDLHCQLYQWSCDVGLGLPFNIASYALLTHMLAHVCDLVPGSLTHAMGDAHIYLNHVDALKTQIKREPREFPELEITREKGGSIDEWLAEDLSRISCCQPLM
jgi:thymidylate synthase